MIIILSIIMIIMKKTICLYETNDQSADYTNLNLTSDIGEVRSFTHSEKC